MSLLPQNVSPGNLLVAHPTGNANVRATLTALDNAHQLAAFATTLGFGAESAAIRWAPAVLKRKLVRRQYSLPSRKILQYPAYELRRLLGFHGETTARAAVDELYLRFDRRTAGWVQRHVAEVNGVYGYEDGCSDTFRVARDNGVKTVYELPIGYWRAARRIQCEERERYPDWAATMPALLEPEWKLERKECELARADIVIVASRFTQATLEGYPGSLPRIACIPYGLVANPLNGKASGGSDLETGLLPPNRPLRAIFVGSLTQRKGLADLLTAVDGMRGAVSLTIVGRAPATCAPLRRELKKHRWTESMARHELLPLIGEHDVLVLPSVFEGFGLVLLEALAQGVPIMATSHTAAPDLIESFPNAGIIVPIRDPEAIQRELENLYQFGEQIPARRRAARAAANAFSFGRYARDLICALQTID